MISGYTKVPYQTSTSNTPKLIKPSGNNQFSESPPIKKLSSEEAKQAIETIKSNMEGWDEVDTPTWQNTEENIDPRDWSTPKRTMQERWNARIFDTTLMLGVRMNCTEYFSFEVNGVPVGVIAMYENHIDKLVTHPGSEGAGGSLIEHAVKQSMESGTEGKLELRATGKDAKHAYLAMGFESSISSPSFMELDPAKSNNKWCQDVHGQWKLTSNMEKKYFHRWEVGDNHPSGPPLKLLNLLDRKGL